MGKTGEAKEVDGNQQGGEYGKKVNVVNRTESVNGEWGLEFSSMPVSVV